jgi:hypothetical protein
MSIFSRKRCKLQSANCGSETPSRQKAESANFPEKNSRRLRNLSQKTRKGQISKKLASKSKKLELNCTNLELNSKRTRSDHAKKPDPSVSSGLKVKNKTIRVLLDSRSSGHLLFIIKGAVNTFPLWCEVGCHTVLGTLNGTFVTDRVGDIEISFVEYLASKKVHLQPDIVEYPGRPSANV